GQASGHERGLRGAGRPRAPARRGDGWRETGTRGRERGPLGFGDARGASPRRAQGRGCSEDQEMSAENAAPAAVVDVKGVVKVFKKDAEEITVLNGIDLRVPEGEFVALMGP